MRWQKVENDPLPKDGPFLALLGDQIGICEYSDIDEQFYFVSEPAYAYSIMNLNELKMNKIEYWTNLPSPPNLRDPDVL